ncbi:hypothetical protein [Fontibacillus sp. BL9]
MIDYQWFIILCIVISSLFTLAVIILTVFTLVFRARVIEKYDRGKPHV